MRLATVVMAKAKTQGINMKKIDIDSYLSDKGRKVRAQLEHLSNEQLALWADSIYCSSFETPVQHIEKAADDFKRDVTPF